MTLENIYNYLEWICKFISLFSKNNGVSRIYRGSSMYDYHCSFQTKMPLNFKYLVLNALLLTSSGPTEGKSYTTHLRWSL